MGAQKFNERRQGDNESFDPLVIDLKGPLTDFRALLRK